MMTTEGAHRQHARKVADAILYEGYLLYPYHQTSQKNQSRFQFGVLMPPAYSAVDPSEPSASQTECLLECRDDAEIQVTVRFLQLQRRRVYELRPGSDEWREVSSLDVDGTEFTAWDEAVERDEAIRVPVTELLTGEVGRSLSITPGETSEDIADSDDRLAGRLIRDWTALEGLIRIRAQRVAGPFGALKLTVRIENHGTPDRVMRDRSDGLAYAFIAAHSLIWAPGGSFLSMTDPPEWAAPEVAACENVGTWPVLAGPQDCRDLMLSSPVILYDHAEVAPESAGDLFDATEIDEILTLRTLALTDSEKRAARATDPRAAELMDRLDGMPPEMFDKMHGAIRYLRAAPAGQSLSPPPPADDIPTFGAGPGFEDDRNVPQPSAPWWDPGSDSSVSPETDHVIVDGVRIARGSRVRMRPGARRADAQDLFLVGREAEVEAVLFDVDGKVHVAVSPSDDPAAELQRNHGRFLYFGTDEIEPIEAATPIEAAGEDPSDRKEGLQ
jgi:hypothetical protein